MARVKPKVSISDSGMIEDERTGLIIPSRMTGGSGMGRGRGRDQMPDIMRNLIEQKSAFDNGLINGYYYGGYAFRRDEQTLIPFIDVKGNDASEIMLDAIASGTISNVGTSPVVFPQIAGLIRNQQAQAQTANVDLTGRQTPVRKAKDALARFNDSPLGATQSMADLVYNLRVFNRGSPIALVPITFDMSVWRENGMKIRPIKESGVPDEKANMFYLEVDWSRVGSPVPYLPEPLDLIPSGSDQWPYWYRAKEGTRRRWVLLHHTQILPIVPGKSLRPKIGTSSVWICLGFLMEEFLVIEERTEKKLASVASGLLGISGTSQNAQQLSEDLNSQKEIMKEEGRYFASDYAIITSNMRPIKFEFLSLRQYDGVEFRQRREYMEDVLALAMQEPLQAVVQRQGVGYSSQAESASRRSSDTGVNAILSILEVAIGAMYPRLQVSVSRPNDPSQQLNIETLSNFANAVKDLNSSVGEFDEPILTREEIRTIIDREVISLPTTGRDIVNSGATTDDTAESEAEPGGTVEEEGAENKQPNRADTDNQNNRPQTEAQRIDDGVWDHFIATLDLSDRVFADAE